MNFFSLDLNTCNLNISRMWLINALLFLKIELLLADSGIPQMAACGVKVGNIKGVKVFGRINYKTEHSGDGFFPKV